MTRRVLIALLALLLTTPIASATDDAITIPVILPLTGPFAGNGELQADAMHLYEGVVNATGGIHGRKLHFEAHDDQGNPVISVQILNELLPKHPLAILGLSSVSTCSAAGSLVANGPVIYCTTPSVSPPKGGYVFSAAATPDSVSYDLYDRARDLGYKRMAMITATDATGQRDVASTKIYFASPRHGSMQLVTAEVISPGDISATAQVAHIKAANPDFIMNWTSGSIFGTVLREVVNAGLDDITMATTPVNANAEQLARYADLIPKALVFTGLPYQGHAITGPLQRAATVYLDAAKKAGISPNASQAFFWDPASITVAALRSLPPDASAAQLRDYIEQLHGFAGLFGMYDFRDGDQHGLRATDLPLIRWNPHAGTWEAFSAGPLR